MKKHFLLCCCLALTAFPEAWGQQNTPRGMEDVNKVTDLTLDSLNKANMARPIPGSSRKGDNPVLFLIGNSTMRTGTLGNGNNGQWGWGYFAGKYFDENRITVENHALGGTSSRTFYTRLWPDVRKGIRKGDWVIIELGHNDNGPFDEGRARATLRGTGKDSLNVTIKETGVKETVYSYGEYLRRYINEVRAVGANPVLFSLTPRNAWDSTGVITRKTVNFTTWIKIVAAEEYVPFIDLEDITARKYETFGPEKVNYMFYKDRIHTSEFGAEVNARSAAEGIAACPGLELKNYLKPLLTPVFEDLKREPGKPVAFFAGDSTVKNKDSDEDGMWGLGSVIGNYLDKENVTVYNCGKAGRSTRTYIEEGHWDRLYNSIRPGDFVFIQFGHNDMGPINTKRARAVMRGVADSSKVFFMEPTRKYKVVYTFGWYLRKMIGDVREKGGIPVLVSLTPRNEWKDGCIERRNDGVAGWTRQVAEQTDVIFVDLHNLTADFLDKKGQKKAAAYYKGDHTHTSKKGAMLNARMIVKSLKQQNVKMLVK